MPPIGPSTEHTPIGKVKVYTSDLEISIGGLFATIGLALSAFASNVYHLD